MHGIPTQHYITPAAMKQQKEFALKPQGQIRTSRESYKMLNTSDLKSQVGVGLCMPLCWMNLPFIQEVL